MLLKTFFQDAIIHFRSLLTDCNNSKNINVQHLRVEFYKKYIKVFNYNFYLRTTLSYFKPLIKVIVYFSKCEKNNLKGLFFYFWASAKKTALLQSSSGEVNHFHLCTNRKGKIIKVLLVRCAVNWIVIGGGMNRKRPFCCTNFTLRLKLAVKV